MNDRLELPALYLLVVDTLAIAERSEPMSWVGDVGFYLNGSSSNDDVVAELLRRRWVGMDPHLVPFARDGYGNRFCFHWGHGKGGSASIVYWRYETYTAIPIASSFDTFLSWIWITAEVTARRGLVPMIDREHVDRDVVGLFRQVGVDRPVGLQLLYEDTASTLHRAIIASDARAAGSLLMAAVTDLDASHDLRVIERCRMAAEAFPEFAGAYVAEAEMHAGYGNERGEMRALLEALRRPLFYSGDPDAMYYGSIPIARPAHLAELLFSHTSLSRAEVGEGLWEVVMHSDPAAPSTWLRLAVEEANEGELNRALTMSSNALWLGFEDPEAGPDALSLFEEIFEALGCAGHAELMHQELARRTRTS